MDSLHFSPTEIALMVSQFFAALPAILAFVQSRRNANAITATKKIVDENKAVADITAERVNGHLTNLVAERDALKAQLLTKVLHIKQP